MGRINRRSFIKLATVAGLSVVTVGITGCGSSSSSAENIDDSAATNMAVVYAARSNSGCVDPTSIGQVESELKQAIKAGTLLAFVLCDGKPQATSAQFTLTSENENRRDNEIDDDFEQVKNFLQSGFTAQTAEIDIFKAITLANSQLGQAKTKAATLNDGTSNERTNTLVIVDSGISTAGSVDFQEESAKNALYDSSGFISSLKQSGDLGKLSNIDKVAWYGLGYTSDPQAEPNAGTIEAMKTLYTAIFNEAGVKDVEFCESDTGSAADGLPNVTAVDLPAISTGALKGDSVSYSESDNEAFRFVFGETSFQDSSKAQSELEPYIKQMKDISNMKITIAAYTDKVGSDAANQKLSQKRAESVKKLFTDAGVSASQITAVGKGVSKKYETDEENRRFTISFN